MSALSLTPYEQASSSNEQTSFTTNIAVYKKILDRSTLTCGLRRTINHVKCAVKTICIRTGEVAQKTLKVADRIVSDPNALASICRRVNFQVIEALDHLKKIPGYLGKFRMACGSFVGVVDAIQVIDDIKWLCTKQYKNDSDLKLASRMAVCVANVTETLSWLQNLSFIHLSRTAAALGEVRLFSFVPKVVAKIPLVRTIPIVMRSATWIGNAKVFSCLGRLSLGAIGGRAIMLYYMLSIADNIKTISKAETAFDKTQAALDISYCLSELTLTALLTLGIASVAGIGILGATSVVTGIASFAHKNSK